MAVPVLPDVLAPGLDVIFCGSAVSAESASAGAYYAGRGNKFWPTLGAVGLTPRALAPEDYPTVLAHGLGLTDLNKRQAGADRGLDPARDDAEALRRKVRRLRPRVLAFVGKGAAAGFYFGERKKTGKLSYGRQPADLGPTAMFVLPSPSGAARRWWDKGPWRALADFVR